MPGLYYVGVLNNAEDIQEAANYTLTVRVSQQGPLCPWNCNGNGNCLNSGICECQTGKTFMLRITGSLNVLLSAFAEGAFQCPCISQSFSIYLTASRICFGKTNQHPSNFVFTLVRIWHGKFIVLQQCAAGFSANYLIALCLEGYLRNIFEPTESVSTLLHQRLFSSQNIEAE